MKPIVPLPKFDPKTALPETFCRVVLNLENVPQGTVIRLPEGQWASIEEAISDPETQITHNGIAISPWELQYLKGPRHLIGRR